MSFQIIHNLGKDPAIRDLSRSSIPGTPAGYRSLSSGEVTSDIGQAAQYILQNSSLGDQITFEIDGQNYLARSEPHYHQAPTPDTDPAEMSRYPKPWGWHRGITIFRSLQDKEPSVSENWQPDKPTSGRVRFLRRISDLISEIED